MTDDRPHLRVPPSPATLAWVRRHTGAREVTLRFLTGGISHSNFALVLDGEQTVVLRRWLRPGWRETDADYDVHREVAALTLLERAGVPAPRLLAADAEGDDCDAPALLMTFLPGHHPDPTTVASPAFLPQLADAALVLHRMAPPWPGIPAYEAYNDLRDPKPPALSTDHRLWERALAAVRDGSPGGEDVFVHRDYHPRNTLWRDQRLVGVVDWTSASHGPVGVDLGHMRWNLVVDHGEDVADGFLAHYVALRGDGFAPDPWWDVRAVVDLLPDHPLTRRDLARLEPYLRRLLAQR